MRFITSALALIPFVSSLVSATALTYKLAANEKACFYEDISKENSKVAFYFAVQSGGSFDVDYSVTSPIDKIVLSGEKERQGDYVFTAQSTGSYVFCFSNTMSTFADKYVDFEITSESSPGTASSLLPQKSGAPAEQHDQLEDLVFKVSGQLSTVNRMQKYFRTRENRNFSTVRSTEKRILQFSMIEVAMMVGMALLQVLVVRFFFQGARKGYV
ncbi:uncharacterized protein HMPREF1541_08971 [Cyphellophora europaea CBS 101466]|uniref:GOLD domain-containing protein n=1 Tax=Cyphellophora europaea (strain CBS 101466) TaxID=1220924 RepID=W2RLV7_CYPE1|nr:uncharacterized protein HMPREF1541_08971 [Cyphellophora europaea CBS 101466]ETN36693.1 hypothetical protein HMPREF1541_08971 [Cyphellophora europaea CBS 101466]